MILPAKHLPPERCISGLGAMVIAQLDEPQSVSETWVRVGRAYGDRTVTFDWFALALTWLYAVGAVDLCNDLLIRKTAL